MARVIRLIRTLFLWRWGVSLFFLCRGVRLHPTAILSGGLSSFHFEKGLKVGARTRIVADGSGRVDIESRVWLADDIEMETASGLRLGRGTTVQRRCTINGSVTIGSECILAPNVFISSGTHPFREVPWLTIREQERHIVRESGSLSRLDRPIEIQDDCWLGTNVVICPGVRVGKGAVIGANSIVIHDVAPYTVVAGSPGKEIGKRLEWQPPESISGNCEKDFPYFLRGGRVYTGSGELRGFSASADQPFCCAIGGLDHLESVTLNVQAPRPMTVSILNNKIEVAAGDSVISVSVGVRLEKGETVYIDVAVADNSDLALVIKEVRGLSH